VLWDIETDPALAGVKLIAEAWDAGGLYQVGNFVGNAWKEWNGMFRDDVREFIAGCPGLISRLPDRLLGSPDVYGHEKREPEQSVNFVTAHDGFTLNDLVSYNEKHNEANGENNQDGESHNRSWNCGVEGVSFDPEIEGLRLRQIKNFFTLTLFAMGTPMIVMGDEVRRTQLGNNNAFCQNNELSWFDWSLVEKNQDLFRFVQQLIKRRLHKVERPGEEELPLAEVLEHCKFVWHGPSLFEPDWTRDARCLAFTVVAANNTNLVHFMANAYWEAVEFELPPDERKWLRVIDTFMESPGDIVLEQDAQEVGTSTYWVQPRSIVVLEVRGSDGKLVF
jgi:glycogen operon protein